MANLISDYMKSWLNTTYEYLQKTGGPTYPPSTVGPNVLPTGPYSLVEDVGISEIPITQYGHASLPFNSGATGIPATDNSQFDSVGEITKQVGNPMGFSSIFYEMFGGLMDNCLVDQILRAKNPDAVQACRDCADTGDDSKIIRRWITSAQMQKNLQAENVPKSDVVQLAENEMKLTEKITEGVGNVWAGVGNVWANRANVGSSAERAPSYPSSTGDPNNPEGSNFQAIGNSVKSFIDPFLPKVLGLPKVPGVPSLNSGTVIMVGGGVLLLILVIAVIK